MGDLSPHFSNHEFVCRDGTSTEIDPQLIEMLEQLRAALGGHPIRITSGYRSPSYNAQVGGAKNSYHLRGMAADIQVPGAHPTEVHAMAERLFPTYGGIGLYQRGAGGWVHIDSRRPRARWTG